MDGESHFGMQAEALLIDTALLGGQRHWVRDGLQAQITPLGRKVVRAATGERPAPRLPKGTLRERQWAALARLYAAGDDGENTSVVSNK